MNSLRRYALLVLAAMLSGCALLPDTRTPYAYAYDDVTLPKSQVALLTTDFPDVKIRKVDTREFSVTATRGHPAKIYVLPGERDVVIEGTGVTWAPVVGVMTKPVPSTHRIKVQPGKVYYLEANGVKELADECALPPSIATKTFAVQGCK